MAKHGDSTLVLHEGWRGDPSTHSIAVPIYQTGSYTFDSSEHAANLFNLSEPGNIYTRLMNPTTEVFEKRLAALEGGVGALATSSGMSAIFLAITNVAKCGDHIIASSSLYGGTETLFRYTLPKFGIEVTFLDTFNAETIAATVKANTVLVYFETIGNPSGDVADLEAISQVAHSHKLPVFIDNTFAPLICKPFLHGVDVVIYSCTKWIGGHGTSIGGAIIDGGNFDWSQGRHPDFTTPDESYHGLIYWDSLKEMAYITKCRVDGMRNMGMCPSPFNSFQMIQGLETLPIRLEKHASNAIELAQWLQEQPEISWVNFVGLPTHPTHHLAQKYLKGSFGSVFGIGIKGGYEAAIKFIDNCQLTFHLANVGDVRSLVIHPASTTHQQMSSEALQACGITSDFVRVSVGIENIEDLKADFKQALEKSQL
jgi:O-acetylhomoserine (thiol)-lyase